MMRASVKGRDACSRETAGRGARPLPTSQPASERTNERSCWRGQRVSQLKWLIAAAAAAAAAAGNPVTWQVL